MDEKLLASLQVSDRLKAERLRAYETLQKTQVQEHRESPSSLLLQDRGDNSPNRTDYVPFKAINTINISDLVTDESIKLEGSDVSTPSLARDATISFEPAEITGRSTLYKRTESVRMSVSEILATSFAQKARDLSEEIFNGTAAARKSRESVCSSTSSRMSCNTLHSLPQTADMSKHSTLSLCGNGTFSFCKNNGDNSVLNPEEEFAPGELMDSKLLSDEISWAQEYAAMPLLALSEPAKEKAARSSRIQSNKFESTPSLNSEVADDPNFSLGKYFQIRSADLSNMARSQPTCNFREPFPLVDDDHTDNTVTTTTQADEDDIGNSTLTTNEIDQACSEDLDKGNSNETRVVDCSDTEQSFLLSMSAIDRALRNMEIHTDDSGAAVVNEILVKAKKHKASKTGQHAINKQIVSPQHRKKSDECNGDMDAIHEFISENKENLDPQAVRDVQLSDTMSCAGSFLNWTHLREMQHEKNKSRSPLSPIGCIPQIHVTEAAHDADIDEWPSTPVKSPNRRVRRTKSPSGQVAQNKKSKSPELAAHNDGVFPNLKTLSSTRIQEVDSGKTVSEYDLQNPSNLAKPFAENAKAKISKDESIHYFNSSSKLSSRSCVSSPVSGCQSPQLDSPTNSIDRHYFPDGGIFKSTSPARSEPCVRRYQEITNYDYIHPPIGSTNLIRVASTTSGRSVSRCSTSSEFSHRDGKIIPLKVTTLELSWGSTKLRTNAQRTMQVKNIASKRLLVRIEIQGPGFQLANNSNTLTLQSQECRTININFCPTMLGAAIGVLSFCSPLSSACSSTPFLDIPLHGYGGHASIVPQDIIKGPVGSPFLPMGDLPPSAQPLERTFRLYNKGPLLGFALVCIDSSGLNLPRLCDKFQVHPESILIPPRSVVTVRVVFRPRREDIKKITRKITHVLTLANMRIICGDEANRQRMRNLMKRMSADARDKVSSNTLNKLWQHFPGEEEVLDINSFKEEPDTVVDLLTCMRIFEVDVTVNNDALDESAELSSLILPDADDTVLFRTVCISSPTFQQNQLEPVSELTERSSMEDDAVVSSSSTWCVSPLHMQFYHNKRLERQKLLLQNFSNSRQHFEIISTHAFLLISPRSGYIDPLGGRIEIELWVDFGQLAQNFTMEHIVITIHMNNEHKEVPIRILRDCEN